MVLLDVAFETTKESVEVVHPRDFIVVLSFKCLQDLVAPELSRTSHVLGKWCGQGLDSDPAKRLDTLQVTKMGVENFPEGNLSNSIEKIKVFVSAALVFNFANLLHFIGNGRQKLLEFLLSIESRN